MAEDSDLEKTEPASARRIEQARERGQVPRSRELSNFAVMVAAGLALYMLAPMWGRGLQKLLRDGLTIDLKSATDPTQMFARFVYLVGDAAMLFMPFLVIVVVIALVSPILVGGWNLSTEALAPDFSRLSPAAGFKRMFSVVSLAELVKAILKTILLGGVAAWAIWRQKDQIIALLSQDIAAGIINTGELVAFTFLALAAAMSLVVVLDVPYQIWEYYKNLRMTREEVRQENKESEGDPQLKARIRQLQRELARRRMMAEVPRAQVVVANPTRYAVALRYEAGKMAAPRVVAKGMQRIAENIRTVADENRIPIVTAPPLARALYRHVELEKEIPAALFNAVAEVLAYVYQLEDYRVYGAHGGRVAPVLPATLPVPPELDPESGITAGAGSTDEANGVSRG